MAKKPRVGHHTTHKPRSAWFEASAAFPLRDADPSQVEMRMFLDPARDPQTWEPMGPVNFAGRVTSLVIHPKTGMLFAGTAAGGVWRSRDLGKTWLPPTNALLPPIAAVDDPRVGKIKSWPTSNIGALAIDPHNPDHIFAATGEANGSADSYPGCGIFESMDSGESWHALAFSEKTGLPRRIAAIVVDPANPEHIRVCGITHFEAEAGGLFFSRNGGITWGAENFFNKPYYCYSMVFCANGQMITSIHARGIENGLWSTLLGGSWMQVTGGLDPFTGKVVPPDPKPLPEAIHWGRTSLAVVPSHPDTVYAFAADRHGAVLGIFRTDDHGAHWRNLAGDHFGGEQQCSYTNCIAVHPEDPDYVVVGGLDIHVSTNGGRSWRHATDDSADPAEPGYVHGDHHALLVLKDGTIIAGGDSGVYVSTNRGRSWKARALGMQTAMFYAMDVAPTNANCMGGGCQDLGTLARDDRDKPGYFRKVIDGDGAWFLYDPEESENIFGGYHNAHIFRHLKGHRDRWVDVSPNIEAAERQLRPIAVMAMDPILGKGRRVKCVYLGTNRLWRTMDLGKTWKPISPVFDETAISAIAIGPDDPDFIMVGTTKGGIYRTKTGGDPWSENFSGCEIPMRQISSIEISCTPGPVREVGQIRIDLHCLCTVAGTGLGVVPVPKLFQRQSGDEALQRGYSHVFASLGHGGIGWKDAEGGSLPDLPYKCCTFETNPPYRVFVAGDFGVFMGLSAGFAELAKHLNVVNVNVSDSFCWKDISGNLPNVIVSDLVYHHKEHALYASTYGRGIWRLKLGGARI